MSMKERFVRKSRSYLAFFLLAAFAALLFFPRVASAAAKPTAKQLKVTYRGFEYDNDTAKLYLKLSLKNTSSYTITKVKMGYEIPIMEDGTINWKFNIPQSFPATCIKFFQLMYIFLCSLPVYIMLNDLKY